MKQDQRGVRAERFIADLCSVPIFKDYIFTDTKYIRSGLQKELCDVALVCGDLVVTIQVKGFGSSEQSRSPTRLCSWSRKVAVKAGKQHKGSCSAIEKGLVDVISNSRNSVSLQNIERPRQFFITAVEYRDPMMSRLCGVPGVEDSAIILNFDEMSDMLFDIDTLWDFEKYLELHMSSFSLLRDVYGETGPCALDVLACVQSSPDEFSRYCGSGIIPGSLENAWDKYVSHPDRLEWRAAREFFPDIIQSIGDCLHTGRWHPKDRIDFDAINALQTEKSEEYIKILNVLAMLPKTARIEITKKILEKSKKYIPGERPRYFSFRSCDGPFILFVVADGDREDRFFYLIALSRELQVTLGGCEVVGIAINSERGAPGEVATDTIMLPAGFDGYNEYRDVLHEKHGSEFFTAMQESDLDRYQWVKQLGRLVD